MKNILTFDVEEYFQVSGFDHVVEPDTWGTFESRVEAQTRRVLDVLDEHDVRATFFVLGWTAERHPDLIREIHRRGHEIASHGYWHSVIYRDGPRAFRRDVRRAKRVLRRILGVEVQGYRAPSFSVVGETLWALPVLAEEGFRYDSSIFPVRHDRYGIPGAKTRPFEVETENGSVLTELPPLTRRFFLRRMAAGGGGWLRLFPYRFVTGAIRRMNEQGHPAVLYLHPWELDPDQPRIPGAKWTSLWRHFVGMRSTERKLRRLLTEHEFTTASEHLGLRPVRSREPEAREVLRRA